MEKTDKSTSSDALSIMWGFLSLPEAEPAAEAWFRSTYPATKAPGRRGTILRKSRWSFSDALLALLMRNQMSTRAIGRIVGKSHTHIGNLFTRLDSHAL